MADVSIRPAIAGDRARVVELLRGFHGLWWALVGARLELGELLAFRPDYAERLFLAHLRGGYSFAIVCERAGAVQGVLLAQAFEHPLAPVFMAKETAWWIDPAHRGRAAIAMLEAYEAWARERGCKVIGMAGMGEDPVVGKLYRRRGYVGVETHFLKQI